MHGCAGCTEGSRVCMLGAGDRWWAESGERFRERCAPFDQYCSTSVLLSSCHRRQEGRGRSDCLEQNGTRELCLVVCACVWVRYNETGMSSDC